MMDIFKSFLCANEGLDYRHYTSLILNDLLSFIRLGLWCIFKNISVISWQSVFVVEETGIPGENHWPVVSHLQIVSHNVISSTIIYTKAVVYGSHSLDTRLTSDYSYYIFQNYIHCTTRTSEKNLTNIQQYCIKLNEMYRNIQCTCMS